MGTIASQITSLTSVYSTVYSGADQSKHQSSASLAFVWGIHRGPVNSPHKWPVTRKMSPFDDVIMGLRFCCWVHKGWVSRFHTRLVVVCFITKSFLTYSFFPPTPALSIISWPLSSSIPDFFNCRKRSHKDFKPWGLCLGLSNGYEIWQAYWQQMLLSNSKSNIFQNTNLVGFDRDFTRA